MKTLSLIMLSALLISSIYIDKKSDKLENLSPVLGSNPMLETPEQLITDQVDDQILFPGQMAVWEAQNFMNESMETQFLSTQIKDQATNMKHLQTDNETMNTYLEIGWLSKLFESKILKK